MLEFFIGLAISIAFGILFIVIINMTGKKKTKSSSAATPTKGNQTTSPTKSKPKFWSIFATIMGVITLIVIIIWAASIVVPLGINIVSLFESKPAVTQTQPAPAVTKTYHTATKAGVKVYMKTEYWSACPVNTKEKIKAVSPTGETIIIELGVLTSTHFTAGWYTFYAVNKNKIKFWVEQ